METIQILVVDDSVMQRQLLVKFLGKSGFDVEAVSSGPECIDFISENKSLDIIIMDYRMPSMNGEDLIKLLHKNGYRGKTIVCTADAQKETRDLFQQVGADAFVTKPLNLKDLKELIHNISS